jgi:hypothetical protein
MYIQVANRCPHTANDVASVRREESFESLQCMTCRFNMEIVPASALVVLMMKKGNPLAGLAEQDKSNSKTQQGKMSLAEFSHIHTHQDVVSMQATSRDRILSIA